MTKKCCSISNFHGEFVWEIPANQPFEVVEANAGGAGRCSFKSPREALFIKSKDGKPPIWAVKNAKCAEASFLTVDQNGDSHLHIVEMKSKLTLKEFQKVLDQWRGMLLASLAVLGIADKPKPKSVTVYIAYNSETVTFKDPAQPILLKVKVGGASQTGIQEWVADEVQLFSDVSAAIVKGQRVGGDYDFGVI